MTRRRPVWIWTGARVAAYLALAGLVLVLWFYSAAEKTPEIDPETGLVIIDMTKPPPRLMERLRAWLGW